MRFIVATCWDLQEICAIFVVSHQQRQEAAIPSSTRFAVPGCASLLYVDLTGAKLWYQFVTTNLEANVVFKSMHFEGSMVLRWVSKINRCNSRVKFYISYPWIHFSLRVCMLMVCFFHMQTRISPAIRGWGCLNRLDQPLACGTVTIDFFYLKSMVKLPLNIFVYETVLAPTYKNRSEAIRSAEFHAHQRLYMLLTWPS